MAFTNGEIPFIFDGTTDTRDLTGYALFRGTTDWANLQQFNQFESGYSLLIVLDIPRFLTELADRNTRYKKLIDTYVHILEYEFRGLSGLDNMQSETAELTNGIQSINVINKVTTPSASQISMRFFEKAGSVLTKVHELYLRGIKDPTTGVKHYNGLIEKGVLDAGFENECFTFMYIVTNNTMRHIEKAYYLVAAQPTNADFSELYNSEKGQYEFKELSIEYNCVPISNWYINERAQQLLDWVRKGTIWNESEFRYSGTFNAYHKTLVSNGTGNTGGTTEFQG